MTSLTIQDEIDLVKKKLPRITIATATNDFVAVVYEKTPTRRIKATLTFPKEYPNVALIVTVQASKDGGGASTAVIPPGLKKKLEKEWTQVAQNHVAGAITSTNDEQAKNRQIFAVLEALQTFVDTNRFVPCWRELKQSVDLIQNLKASSSILSMNESKGTIKIKLATTTTTPYQYTCTITIDEGYPTTSSIHDWGNACRIKVNSSSYPLQIQNSITKQFQDFVRLLQDGMPEEQARQYVQRLKSNPSSAIDASKKDNKGSKGNKDSISSKEESWQTLELARISNYEIPTYDGSQPQPSLLPLVKLMVETITKTISSTKCPICKESSFPTDPAALAKLFATTKNKAIPKRRPMQPSCGCWYHYECLNTLLTQPPFGEQCPTCIENDNKGAVTHPHWTKSRQELEQAWASRQAKQREIDDVAMMF